MKPPILHNESEQRFWVTLKRSTCAVALTFLAVLAFTCFSILCDHSSRPQSNYHNVGIRRKLLAIDPKTITYKTIAFHSSKSSEDLPKLKYGDIPHFISSRKSFSENLQDYSHGGVDTNRLLFLTLFHADNSFFEKYSRLNDYFISVEFLVNSYKTLGYCNLIRVGFQNEHTLVKNKPTSEKWEQFVGDVKDDEGNPFLVRVVGIENYPEMDMILEYSMPNIENMRRSGLFDPTTLKKIVYVPPINRPYVPRSLHQRDLGVVVTFMGGQKMSPRRANLMSKLADAGIQVDYVTGLDPSGDEMMTMMDRTKILLNVHQSDDHWTLEELRVLPALLRGVVVISESVPLSGVIPYGHKIIFTPYEQLVDAVVKIHSNYNLHFENIHNEETELIINNMKSRAKEDIQNRLIDILKEKEDSFCMSDAAKQER
eukprot:CAMPEP_0194394720 /NCGR_PEP_ID=MMETSP0174-20130528/124013_1 /TAXON_ID=216777 /ORGANISM="Proboscia alata, Strain PI-D3" /LENGTH=426 /DNA_ID=CAMNT_0039190553 /DNA_START=751 /DNA_END=2031 /DNA_ORIENTATION=+